MQGTYFRVDGADHETGEETYLVVQASTSAQAEAIARHQGLLISTVRPASAADWGAGPALGHNPGAPGSGANVAATRKAGGAASLKTAAVANTSITEKPGAAAPPEQQAASPASARPAGAAPAKRAVAKPALAKPALAKPALQKKAADQAKERAVPLASFPKGGTSTAPSAAPIAVATPGGPELKKASPASKSVGDVPPARQLPGATQSVTPKAAPPAGRRPPNGAAPPLPGMPAPFLTDAAPIAGGTPPMSADEFIVSELSSGSGIDQMVTKIARDQAAQHVEHSSGTALEHLASLEEAAVHAPAAPSQDYAAESWPIATVAPMSSEGIAGPVSGPSDATPLALQPQTQAVESGGEAVDANAIVMDMMDAAVAQDAGVAQDLALAPEGSIGNTAPIAAAQRASRAPHDGATSPLATLVLWPLGTIITLGGIGLLAYALTRPPAADDATDLAKLDQRIQSLTQCFLGGVILLAGLLLFVTSGVVYLAGVIRQSKPRRG